MAPGQPRIANTMRKQRAALPWPASYAAIARLKRALQGTGLVRKESADRGSPGIGAHFLSFNLPSKLICIPLSSAEPWQPQCLSKDVLKRVAAHAIGHVGLEVIWSGGAHKPFRIGKLARQMLRLGEPDIGRRPGGRNVDALGRSRS
jgi:hypothetical protein